MASKAALSHGDKRSMVRSALQSKVSPDSYVSIEDMFDDSVVYTASGDVMKQAPYKIDGDTVSVGDGVPVRETKKYEPVTVSTFEFSDGDGIEEGDMVRYPGVLFEAGDYPDKGVKFDNTDLDNAIDGVVRIPNDLEHKRTILSGQLGFTENLRRVGSQILGDVLVPRWLRDRVGNKISVSLAFNHAKQVVGNALTWNPRIQAAEVEAAFTEFTQSSGTPGPTKGARNGQVDMSKPEGKGVVRRIIDLLTKAEAGESVEFTLHDDPRDAKIAELERKIEAMGKGPEFSKSDESTDRAKAEAARIVEDYIKAGKVTPAERGAMISVFSNAILDDMGDGTIKFAADASETTGTRLDALKSATSARVSVITLRPSGAVTVFSNDSDQGGSQSQPVVIDSAAAYKAASGK